MTTIKFEDGKTWAELDPQVGDLVQFWKHPTWEKGSIKEVVDSEFKNHGQISLKRLSDYYTEEPRWHMIRRKKTKEEFTVTEGDSMSLHRLPKSPNEDFPLMAYVKDDGSVSWVMYDSEFYNRSDSNEDWEWYDVWREEDAVCVKASCWFHDRGIFMVKVTDLEPSEVVRRVHANHRAFHDN